MRNAKCISIFSFYVVQIAFCTINTFCDGCFVMDVCDFPGDFDPTLLHVYLIYQQGCVGFVAEIMLRFASCNVCAHFWGNIFDFHDDVMTPLIARFMGPTWGPSGTDRTQVGTVLATWTLLCGTEKMSTLFALCENLAWWIPSTSDQCQ